MASEVTLESAEVLEEGAELFALRFSHPDSGVRGRRWTTEVGARRTAAGFTCSVVLRTEEASALVQEPIQTTRPALVVDIYNQCKVASETLGGIPRGLRLDDAELLLQEIRDPGRRHPIVEVSSLASGSYAADPDRLSWQLVGVAPVAVIPPDVDTFALEQTLSARFCCYHGAVNIVWPAIGTATESFIPNTRLMAHQLDAMRARGYPPENEVLAIICDRSNEALARDHLTLGSVRAAKHRIALAAAIQGSTKTDPDLEKLIAQVDIDQRAEISDLKTKLEKRDRDVAALHAKAESKEVTIDSLKASLDAASRTSDSSRPLLPDCIRQILIRALTDESSIADALAAVAALYPERLVVLDSAWKSARAAGAFRQPNKVFELLQKLCMTYWESLSAGKGDGEARAVFGNAFSAKESETVERNKRARALRTFTYKGKAIEMMKHLKIGNKESDAETFRAHFEWDDEERKVVLGHCGRHLDHK